MGRAKKQAFVSPCDWRNLIKRWCPQHVCFLQCRAPANQVFVLTYKFHKNVTLFLAIPAENRIQLLWNKYFIYDTVKKNITEVAQFFFARACRARLEALYIILFPMGGTTMQASTSPWFLWGCIKVGTFEIYVLSIPNARKRSFRLNISAFKQSLWYFLENLTESIKFLKFSFAVYLPTWRRWTKTLAW